MDNIKKMRAFHNNIKKSLINSVSNNNTTLLDVGVGRGGDILKWHNIGIHNVVGIDIDEAYIDEAKNRLKNSIIQIRRRNYRFYKYDGTNIKDFLKQSNVIQKFDVISCQFAMHYFFKDADTLDNFIKNISSLLSIGGYFIGTFMDGYKIDEFLKKKTNNNVIFINKQYSELKQTGSEIKVHLCGTLYFQEKSISTEYLILFDVFESICKKHGLVCINRTPFEEYYKYNTIVIEDKNVLETSFLNNSFTFVKTVST